MKICGQCGAAKSATEFHRRAASIDGLSACCKSCQRAYDAARLHKPDRVARRRNYRTTEAGQERLTAGKIAWIKRNPNKRHAHIVTNNAIRDGLLIRQPCEKCGDPAEAHHDDYDKPMEVRWMCDAHHKAYHRAERNRAAATADSVMAP